MAVLGRLWVRIKVVREPGLDDAFVLFAAVRRISEQTALSRMETDIQV
jgi:hypothetical protein